MQLRIDLKIFLFLLIFFLTKQIEVYLLFMLFAIVHELGHLFVGVLLGFKPKGININPFGLSICFYINCNEYSKNLKKGRKIILKKLLIALAGPIINFFIALCCIFFDIEILQYIREEIIYTNLIIGFFNLIPIYPLDGGRIIKYIIHINKNLINAYKYTYIISNTTLIILTAISSIVILYLKNIAILFIVLYLWIMIIKENKIYTKKMQLYKLINP